MAIYDGPNDDGIILGSTDSDILVGLDTDDVMDGGAGDDVLSGGAGNDTLTGGSGSDVLDGGEGTDTAVFSGLLSDYQLFKVGSDFVLRKIPTEPATKSDEINTLINIEKIIIGGVEVDLTNTANIISEFKDNYFERTSFHEIDTAENEIVLLDDVITGTPQNDSALPGTSGSDVLDGGEGTDTVTYAGQRIDYEIYMVGDNAVLRKKPTAPATESDEIDILYNVETIVFAGDDPDTTVDLTDAASVATEFGSDYYVQTDFQEIDSSGNNIELHENGSRLTFNTTGDDHIVGGNSGETIRAGQNVDYILGGDGNDIIDGGQQVDFIDGGAGDDEIIGSQQVDYILGGSGSDIIQGDQQSDILNGGAGDDNLDGGSGDDTLTGGEGNDTITGGTGTDIAVFAGNRNDYTIEDLGNDVYRITDNNAGDGDDGVDTVTGISFLKFKDITIEPSGNLAPTLDLDADDSGPDGVTGGGDDTSGNDYVVDFTEDGGPVTLSNGIDIQDDSGQLLRLQLTVNGLADGAGEVLSIHRTEFTLDGDYAAVTVNDGDGGVDFDVAISNGGNTVTVTRNGGGTATLADFEALIGSVTYENKSQSPTTADPRTIDFRITDGGGLQNPIPVAQATVSVTGVNDAPVITSDGGGDTATKTVDENTLAVTTVTSTDVDAGDTATYAITGGADETLFNIDSATGELSFIAPPDFEDGGHAPSYEVAVTVTDSDGLTDTQTLTVTVDDVNEAPMAENVDLGLTLEDTSRTFSATDLLAASADVDGDTLSVTEVTVDPAYGAVTETSPGIYRFDPKPDLSATNVALSFTVSDGELTDIATATLDITPVADQPDISAAPVFVEPPGMIVGTENNDTLNGTSAGDTIIGLGGDDTIHGNNGGDIIYGDHADVTVALNLSAAVTDTDGSEEISSLQISLIPEGATLRSGGMEVPVSSGVSDLLTAADLGQLTLTLPADLSGLITLDVLVEVTDTDTDPSAPDPTDVITKTLSVEIDLGVAGDDTIHGGAGDDIIHGGAGDDHIEGNGGNDQLFGGLGNDFIRGQNNFDELHGGEGDDKLFAGQQSDDLFGDDGNDVLEGRKDGDNLFGGAGDDYIEGDRDDNLGFGDDEIQGGDGSDTVYGGGGGDTIFGGAGDDFLSGDDLDFSTLAGHADQRLTGISDADPNRTGTLDQTRANDGADVIDGGAGNDIILGGGGNDVLTGGTGDDTLVDGAGFDSVDGGEGNDTVVFTVGQNVTGPMEVLNGGKHTDALDLQLTQAQMDDPVIAAELGALATFIRNNSDPTRDDGPSQTFSELGITVSNFEAFLINGKSPPKLDLDADDSGGTGGNNFTENFIEDLGPVSLSDGIAISDDSGELASLRLTVSGAVDGADEVLNILGTDFALNMDRSETINGFDVIVSSADGTVTATPVSASVAPLADFQALIESVTYVNKSQSPTEGARTIVFTITDGDDLENLAPQPLATVTVTGTNDQPVVTVVNDAVDESDGIEIFSGSVATANDLDITDTHTYSKVIDSESVSPPAGVTLGAVAVAVDAAGSYSVTGNFDALAEGETATITFDYVATDDSGAANAQSEPQTVTLTVTGTNDQPVVTVVNDAVDESDGIEVFSGSVATASDLDITDTHTYSKVIDSESVTPPAGVTLGAVTVAVDAAGGYSVTGNFDALAEGEVATVTFDYVATDDSGAPNAQSEPQTVTLTVTGTNDQPVVTVVNDAVDEGDGIEVFTGSVATATDLDVNDTHTYSKVADSESVTTSSGVVLSGISMTVDPSGDYSVTGNFDALTEGETATITFDYVALDNSGAANAQSEPQTVTLTVTGTNDWQVFTDLNNDELTITEGDSATILDQDTLTTFIDPDFNAGALTVALTLGDTSDTGGSPDFGEEVLLVKGVDGITVNNETVYYNGLDIGVMDSGANGVDLLFDFNGNASDDAVQALIRSIAYRNDIDFNAQNPDLGERTVIFTVDDGAGGPAATAQTTIVVNDNIIGLLDAASTLKGGVGDDHLFGRTLDDNLDGGEGHDALHGNDGVDALTGGAGNDLLNGGKNDDTLIGGVGDDTLIGGAGENTADGGDGTDTAEFAGNFDNLAIESQGGGQFKIVNPGDAASYYIIERSVDPDDGNVMFEVASQSTASVTIDVHGVGDESILFDDNFTTDEDQALLSGGVDFDVTANDSDPQGNLLTIDSVNNITISAWSGKPIDLSDFELSITGDNKINLKAFNDFNQLGVGQSATIEFDYTTNGSAGASAHATITVNGVNDNPTAKGDYLSIAYSQKSLILNTAHLYGNDTDIEGDAIHVSSVWNMWGGDVSFNMAAGSVTFNHNYDLSGGIAQFGYSIEDSWGGVDTGIFTIQVRSAFSDCPIVVDLSTLTDIDTTSTVFSDLGENGIEFVDLADSSASYDLTGDGFSNHTSWVTTDDALLAYDKHGDGNINETNEIRFSEYAEDPAPENELKGLAHFDTNEDGVLDASDAEWGKFGLWRDADSDGVTDGGEFISLAEAGIKEIALDAVTVHNEDGDVTITEEGSFVNESGSTGNLVGALFGHDTEGFKREVDEVTGDLTVTIKTYSEIDASISAEAFRPDGLDPSYNTITPSSGWLYDADDGAIKRNPAADASEEFTVTWSGGPGPDLTVTAKVLTQEIVRDDLFLTSEDSSLSISLGELTENDEHLDFDPQTITFDASSENGGTVDVIHDSEGLMTSIEYTPDENFHGIDSFTYTAVNDSGGIDKATVTIHVEDENDLLVAADDYFTTDEDTAIDPGITIDVLANDINSDNDFISIDSLSKIAVTAPSGTMLDSSDVNLVVTADNKIHFTGSDDFNNLDNGENALVTFDYTITDGTTTLQNIEQLQFGETSLGFVTGDGILNGSAADDLVLGGDGNDQLYGSAGNDHLWGNAGDDAIDGGDGDDTVMLNGHITDYAISAPGPTVTVEDLNVYDGDEGLDTLTGVERVQFLENLLYLDGTNNAPVITGETLIVSGVASATLSASSLTENAWDYDGDLLSIQAAGNPSSGTVAVNGNGDVEFTVTPGFDGFATFNYTISDNNGGIVATEATVAFKNIINGTAGHDNPMNGTAAGDAIYGLDGYDALYGGDGDDILFGGNGSDSLNGGAGNDIILGGDGLDYMYASAGDDIYDGGEDGSNDQVTYAASHTSFTIENDGAGGYTVTDLSGTYGTDFITNVTWINFNDANWNVANPLRALIYGDNDVNVLYGSDWIDLLTPYDGDDVVYAMGGDDNVNGNGGNDTISGGDGNDQLWGHEGSDIINGDAGDDILWGGAGNEVDILHGGAGNDTLWREGGDDVFQFNRGGGVDHIFTYGTGAGVRNEKIQFGANIAMDQLWFSRVGNYLEIQVIGTDDSISVVDWYLSADNRVGSIETADGAILLESQVQTLVDAMATMTEPPSGQLELTTAERLALAPAMASSWTGAGGYNLINGTAAFDDLTGTAAGDAIYGLGWGDTLNGAAGNDIIFGGDASDSINGGAGNDIILGGDGLDYMYASAGDDIYDGGEDGSNDQVTYAASHTSFTIENDGAGGYTVTDLSGTYGTDFITNVTWINFNDANWNVANPLRALIYGDNDVNVLYGSDWIDLLTPYDGDDVVYAMGGDDNVNGNGGNDTISGGDGNDQLWGHEGSDIINGDAGDDILWGGAGNEVDILHGGAGNDTLWREGGDDVFQFNRGGGVDHIFTYGTGAGVRNEKIQFGANIAMDQLWFSRVGNYLEIQVIGTDDSISVVDWYLSADNRVGSIETADGAILLESQVQTLVDAMATMTEPPSGQLELTTAERLALAPAMASSWTGAGGYNLINGTAAFDDLTGTAAGDAIYGLGWGDTLNGAAGNDIIFGGDASDSINGGAGNDIILGGDGLDYMYASAGDDIYDGGEDGSNDQVTYAASHTSFTIENDGAGGYTVTDLSGTYGTDFITNVTWINFNDANWNVANPLRALIYGDNDVNVLYGSDWIDLLTPYDGDDVVYAMGGDDNVNGNGGNDTISGGDGNDQLWGHEGSDIINGDAGDDQLWGGTDNDTLQGGDGDDSLWGGTGDDTFLFNRGDDADHIFNNGGGASDDWVKFGTDVNTHQLWFSRTGNDLEVDIIGTEDKVTIDDWYVGTNNRVAGFETSDGAKLQTEEVENLVTAMAAETQPDLGQEDLTPELESDLGGIIDANW